ncbi:MAG: DUF6599 family protein [Bacteroidales bacterium]
MKKIIIILLVLSLHYFHAATGQEIDEVVNLLPSVEGYSNWSVKDSAEIFYDDDLFLYINGGADIYLEYGFEKVVACKYRNFEAHTILIDIYKMTDPTAAYGIFSLNSSNWGKAVDLGTASILYDYYLDSWKGSYFIRFTANNNEPGMMDTLLLLAKQLDSKIEEKGKLPHLSLAFDLPDIEFETIKYIRGIIALNNVFNFGHGSISGFSEGLIGSFDGKMLFAFSYADDKKRREWFASAKGKMQMSKKFTDYTEIDEGFTVKDKSGSYLCFKPYKRFIIVVKGENWEEAQSVFINLQKNLDGI